MYKHIVFFFKKNIMVFTSRRDVLFELFTSKVAPPSADEVVVNRTPPNSLSAAKVLASSSGFLGSSMMFILGVGMGLGWKEWGRASEASSDILIHNLDIRSFRAFHHYKMTHLSCLGELRGEGEEVDDCIMTVGMV